MSVVKQQTTVFEFGYLGCCDKAKASGKITAISEGAFNYLKNLCLCDESESRFLQLKSINNCEVLQVKNYVGVVFMPDGSQIEVLPKVAKVNSDAVSHDDARASLLMMLKTLKSFRYLQTNSAQLAKNKMPLLEVFISQFLTAVNRLIKRGLRSDYVREQDNLAFLKGKLLVGKQLRHNAINKHKFYVEYDEFLQDRPANRLIHSALRRVNGYSRNADNQKLCRELLFAFADIPVSKDISNDFAQLKLDRSMSHYESSLAWTRLILDGFSPLTLQGKTNAFSLLFPMESVFESYVASILNKYLPTHLSLTTQASSKSLVVHNKAKHFRLKPDLLIQHALGEKKGLNHSVLDTKWKLVKQDKSAYGLSQSDFYQMFAYGHKYLNGAGELFLIYPAHEDFKEPIEHSFDFDEDAKLKLWVVPFDIFADLPDRVRLKMPVDCLLKAN